MKYIQSAPLQYKLPNRLLVTPQALHEAHSPHPLVAEEIPSHLHKGLPTGDKDQTSASPNSPIPSLLIPSKEFTYSADDDYNYDLFGNFDDNLTHYDWAAAYDKSTSTDYSDFKPFVLFSKEEMTYLGTQAKDFIVQCTFDGREYPSATMGNCFIINSIYNQTEGVYSSLRNTSKTGKEFGLKLTLFLDKAENIGLLNHNSGAHVLINAPYVPPLPESDSWMVNSGTATMISVKQDLVTRKGGNYGKCLDEWPEFVALDTDFTKRWPRYDQRACERYCMEVELYTRCGCIVDYYDNSSVPLCSAWDKKTRDCETEVFKAFRNNEFTCPCEAACNDEFYTKASTMT
ncbi:epithelial sodium channel subunit alpha-like [Convolutriloba macropyga]|uniref:epithelial sodium channel subunit alpha-like n=1 Tax=Convolutriloba macropyga TaxID=536237 RepID=UPI003F51FDA8